MKNFINIFCLCLCACAGAQVPNPNLPTFQTLSALGVPNLPAANPMGMPVGAPNSTDPKDFQPYGFSGIQPISKLEDGTPVYNLFPVYSEVKGAFAVIDYFSGKIYRFPADKKGRHKVGRHMMREVRQSMAAFNMMQDMQTQSYRQQSAGIDAEKEADQWRAKARRAADKAHQDRLDQMDRQFYHMNDNQLKHYREGWKPVVQPVGGVQFGTPDLMVAPGTHDVYHVW